MRFSILFPTNSQGYTMLTVKLVILFFLSLIAAAPIDKVEPPITHVVTFHVNQGSEPIGNMTLGLFGSVAPKTVENFFQLATMQNGFGYHKNIFHRVIKDFMIQGGDFENHDGTGGHSIYGTHKGALPDENFHLKHDRPGRLAMANSGKNTGGSQFFITSGEASWLDGHHVVFGQLIDGTETFKQIEEAPTTQFDKPMTDIVISTVSFEKRSLNGTALKDNDGTPDASDSTSGEASDPKDDDTTEKSSHHDYGLIALIALGIGALIVGIKYRAAIKNKITSLGYKRLF